MRGREIRRFELKISGMNPWTTVFAAKERRPACGQFFGLRGMGSMAGMRSRNAGPSNDPGFKLAAMVGERKNDHYKSQYLEQLFGGFDQDMVKVGCPVMQPGIIYARQFKE